MKLSIFKRFKSNQSKYLGLQKNLKTSIKNHSNYLKNEGKTNILLNNEKEYKTKFCKIQRKHLSIIHNYHCPKVLYSGMREFTYEEKTSEYNKYIQAFLNKRFTHKKEITPKISIINVPNGYHNTLYIQQSYPFYTLYDIQNMRFMKNLNVIDTGYIISRFFEEFEKPMYDAVLSKLIVSGRIEFMEDQSEFTQIKEKINKIVDIFYNGDVLSPLEREIERSYIILKMQKQNELMKLYASNTKLKREDIFVSYSEMNKFFGHVNFRMHHPEYNFKPRPEYEKVNVEQMFYNLYEIRFNSLKENSYLEKLKLRYHYRKSLIENSDHRVKFLSNYIFTQIIQYIDSWEFNNFFDLNLNFKVNLNLAILHTWFIINRLINLSLNKEIPSKTKTYCKFLIEGLIESLINYSENNQFKFEFYNNNKDLDKVSDSKFFIKRLLDQYTFHFEIFNLTKNNNFLHLPLLLNGMIFNGDYNLNDKSLNKFALYVYEHFWYFSNKSYEEIETSDFNFSIYKVPINYNDYILNRNVLSMKNFNSYSYFMKDYFYNENIYKEHFKNFGFEVHKIEEDFKNNKNKLLTYKRSISENNAEWIIKEYGTIPYENKKFFIKYDFTKSWIYRIYNFFKNENDIEKGLLLEKVIRN